MEIIRDNTKHQPHKSFVSAGNIYVSFTLIIAGLLWMLYNLNILSCSIFHAIFSWETLLVIIGGYLLFIRRWVIGGIVTAVGILYLLSSHFGLYVPIGEILFPGMLIALGIAFLIPRK